MKHVLHESDMQPHAISCDGAVVLLSMQTAQRHNLNACGHTQRHTGNTQHSTPLTFNPLINQVFELFLDLFQLAHHRIHPARDRIHLACQGMNG